MFEFTTLFVFFFKVEFSFSLPFNLRISKENNSVSVTDVPFTVLSAVFSCFIALSLLKPYGVVVLQPYLCLNLILSFILLENV